MRDEIREFLMQGTDALRQVTAQLLQRGSQTHLGPRANHIEHGFALRQVNPPIQEGPFRKLAWLRESRTSMQGQFHNPP